MTDFIRTIDAKGSTSQAKFVNEREAEFWVRARRNRLLAEWACGLTDESSQNYLKVLLDIDFAKAGDHDREDFLLVKIRNDLMGFGVFLPLSEIRDMLERFEEQARREKSEAALAA
ncbi:ATPase inhibitor subunit zeta [Telmatospirillum sp. J64-1]|uniref:ATPase inhibitor subunit zeta n=1 Tax=Telmatospirillum sp. J64-1 TaxID=2502183 RepID=UPI00115F0271|nr:ATPase inhibitor subunit zeta [Telmatospirillum sp. J64-1]